MAAMLVHPNAFGLDNAQLIKAGRMNARGEGGRWRPNLYPGEFHNDAFGDDPWGMTHDWNDSDDDIGPDLGAPIDVGATFGDAFPGVDVRIEPLVADAETAYQQGAQSIAAGVVSLAMIETEPYADALVSLGDAARAIQGAAGQLGETRRGVASGQRYRLRRLIPQLQRLAAVFFRGATDASGASVTSDMVLPELPETVSVGPPRALFGAGAPSHVSVETDDGPLLISAAAALASAQVIEAADAIATSADAVRDWAFQHQTVDSGHPVMPAGNIIQALQSQTDLVQSGFKFGGKDAGRFMAEGAAAERAHHPKWHNPHARGSWQGAAWDKGWARARRDWMNNVERDLGRSLGRAAVVRAAMGGRR